MENFKHFFSELWSNLSLAGSADFWLETQRQVLVLDWLLGCLAVLALVVHCVLFLAARKFKGKDTFRKDYLKRWKSIFLIWGVVGLLWFLARFEYARILGGRLIYAGLLVLVVILSVRILIFKFVKLPKEQKRWQEMETKAKYL